MAEHPRNVLGRESCDSIRDGSHKDTVQSSYRELVERNHKKHYEDALKRSAAYRETRRAAQTNYEAVDLIETMIEEDGLSDDCIAALQDVRDVLTGEAKEQPVNRQ